MISYILGFIFTAVALLCVYNKYKGECKTTFTDLAVACILTIMSWFGLIIIAFTLLIYYISNYIDEIIDKIYDWLDSKRNKENKEE
jgi:uncharacterized protein involved in cysteine biosynthesis